MPARRDDEMLDLLNEAVCLRIDIHDLDIPVLVGMPQAKNEFVFFSRAFNWNRYISNFANVLFIIIWFCYGLIIETIYNFGFGGQFHRGSACCIQ